MISKFTDRHVSRSSPIKLICNDFMFHIFEMSNVCFGFVENLRKCFVRFFIFPLWASGKTSVWSISSNNTRILEKFGFLDDLQCLTRSLFSSQISIFLSHVTLWIFFCFHYILTLIFPLLSTDTILCVSFQYHYLI